MLCILDYHLFRSLSNSVREISFNNDCNCLTLNHIFCKEEGEKLSDRGEKVKTLKFPNVLTVIGFANDIRLTIVAQDIEEIKILTNDAILKIRSKLKDGSLALAEYKIEVKVCFTQNLDKEETK